MSHTTGAYVGDDRTRPLTVEGKEDSKMVVDFLKDKAIDVFYSSPYQRSIDTIADTAAFYGKDSIVDERLREREKDINGNQHGMFEKGTLLHRKSIPRKEPGG